MRFVGKWFSVDTRTGRQLLMLFLIAVGVFLVFHLRSVVTGGYPGWLLQMDHGRPEVFAYLLFGWTVVALLLLARRWRALILVGWAALVGFMLADDFMRLHEKVGWWAWHRLSPQWQARMHEQTLEILVLSAFAVVLGGFVLVAHRRAEGRARVLSGKVLAWVLAIGFFAFGVDLLSTRSEGALYQFFTILEDGGELVSVAFLAALVIGTWLEDSRSSAEDLAQVGREPGIHDDAPGGAPVAEDRLGVQRG